MRRFVVFFLGFWVASLLVFFFVSVGGFLLLLAIRRAVFNTFQFRADPDSRFGIRPVGLRLRTQPRWANALWLVSNAAMFALAVYGLIFVRESLIAILIT
jgi:hypothetical protein